MPDNKEIIVPFNGAAEAVMAEEALTRQGFAVRVMPTPSGIRAGCGFCLRFPAETIQEAAAFLAEQGIAVAEAYTQEESGGAGAYRKAALPLPRAPKKPFSRG
jgi:rhodanese-related sulfurtransferase